MSRFLCMQKILVHAQHSLCMHNTLVHALEGPGIKAGTQKKRWGSGLGQRFFWVPALVPGPFSARTRVLCMHKSVVHAQECSACTKNLCMHKNLKKNLLLGRCAASFCFFRKNV